MTHIDGKAERHAELGREVGQFGSPRCPWRAVVASNRESGCRNRAFPDETSVRGWGIWMLYLVLCRSSLVLAHAPPLFACRHA